MAFLNHFLTRANNTAFGIRLIVLLLSLLAISCAPKVKTPSDATSTISLTSYNVENLFDTEHDQNRGDFEYLPLETKKNNPIVTEFCNSQPIQYRKLCFEKDWSEPVLKEKLNRIADTLKQVQVKDRIGSDIIVLSEVENIRVLDRLISQHMKGLGYKTASLIEGDDFRGIDVAVVSRFPLAEPPKLHRIQFSDESLKQSGGSINTRGILEVPLKLPNNKILYVFAVHFPSQANPTEQRRDAVETLNKLYKNLPAGSYAVVAGDLNITKKEEELQSYYKKNLSHLWNVSHFVGCQKCPGTHFYRGEWSFLDAILFSKNMSGKDKVAYNPRSIQVLTNGRYQMNEKEGTPWRFNPQKEKGVSDHLPLYVEFTLKN